MILAGRKIRQCLDTVATLSERLDRLEADRQQHLLELDEMYEKIRRLYGRIQKRHERATQGEGSPEVEESPCSDPISARVQEFRKARSHVLG